MKICLFLCLVTLIWLEFADSAGLTKPDKDQFNDITNLIELWTFDSVNHATKVKSGMYKLKGYHTKQDFRLDQEQPTAQGFNKYRIQSGKLTYSDVLIEPEHHFGKTAIRNAFVQSAKTQRVITLGHPTKHAYSAISKAEDEPVLEEDEAVEGVEGVEEVDGVVDETIKDNNGEGAAGVRDL